MIGPTPSTAESVSTGADGDAVEVADLAGERLRRGGPDVPDGQRDEDPPERAGPSRSRARSSSFSALAVSGRALAGAPVAGEERAAPQVVGGEQEDVALVGHDPLVEQRHRRLEPEALDVEGAARRQVEDPLAQLGRAGPLVGAPDVDVALLRGRERGAARRAVRGHHERALRAGALLHHGTEHLGDDVAGLAQEDEVADEHALAERPPAGCAAWPSTRWSPRP